MSKALEYLLSRPLLCTPEAAEAAALIASRDPEAPRFELVSMADATRPDTSRIDAGKTAGVGVISARGVISRYTTMMQGLGCGGTSVDAMARDIRAAVADPSTRCVLIDCDSPGGQADGIGELAGLIRRLDARKPIYAYVGEQSSSAMYWLSAACRQIACAETAWLGSIGCVFGQTIAADRPGVKRYKFVSTHSPLKQADASTETGSAVMQSMADAMAEAFVCNVARLRGVSREHVLSNFGQGAEVMGHAAVAAGMADGVSDFDTVLGRLSRGLPAVDAAPSTPTEPVETAVPATAATSPHPTPKGQSMNIAALFGLAKKNPEVAAALGVVEADVEAAAVDAASVAVVDLAAGKPHAIPADVLAKIQADAIADYKAAQADGLIGKFTAEATTFFASLVAGGRALPHQMAAFVAHYVDAAKLDATAPLKSSDGTAVNRVDSLKSLAKSAPVATPKTKDAVAETPEALAAIAAASGLTPLAADATADEAKAASEAAAKAAALKGFGPVAVASKNQ